MISLPQMLIYRFLKYKIRDIAFGKEIRLKISYLSFTVKDSPHNSIPYTRRNPHILVTTSC